MHVAKVRKKTETTHFFPEKITLILRNESLFREMRVTFWSVSCLLLLRQPLLRREAGDSLEGAEEGRLAGESRLLDDGCHLNVVVLFGDKGKQKSEKGADLFVYSPIIPYLCRHLLIFINRLTPNNYEKVPIICRSACYADTGFL